MTLTSGTKRFARVSPLALVVILAGLQAPAGAQTRYRECLRNGAFESLSGLSPQDWSLWPPEAARVGHVKFQLVPGRKDGQALRVVGLHDKQIVLFQTPGGCDVFQKGKTYIGSIWSRGSGKLSCTLGVTSSQPAGEEYFPTGRVSFGAGAKADEWRRFEFRFTPERDWGHPKFILVFNGTGTLDLDEASFLAPVSPPAPKPEPESPPASAATPAVVVPAPAPSAPAAAPPPVERVSRPTGLDWSYGAMWKRDTATHRRVCLNGYWRFQPATGESKAIPSSGWGFLRLPGCWYCGYTWTKERHFRVYGSDEEKDLTWNGQELGLVTAGWFQREVDIPADWSGRRILMELGTVNASAEVFWNGRSVGTVDFVAGATLDVTQAVQFGRTNVVSLLVRGVRQGGHYAAGISGDLYLEATPPGPRITFLRTETDCAAGRAGVCARVRGGQGRQVFVECAVEENGKTVATWRTAKPVPLGGEEAEVRVSGALKDIRLWDLVDNPALYDLKVRLVDSQGKLLDEDLVEGAGFREFRCRGNQFYLNGSVCRLRPTVLNANIRPYGVSPPAIRELMANLKEAGYNALYVWAIYSPQDQINLELTTLLREADRQGIAAMCSIPGVWRLHTEDEAGQKLWRQWRAWVGGAIDRYGRDPSVLIWVTNINYPVYGGTGQDPSKMDGVYQPTGDATFQKDCAIVRKSIDILHKLDPTRPVIDHDSCNAAGDIYAQNNYLCWTPLQEREEWLSAWGTRGVKPLQIGEYGSPSNIALNIGRPGPGVSISSERMATEFCAMYLGPEAYRLEEDRYVRYIAESYVGPGKSPYGDYTDSFWFYNWNPPSPYLKLLERFVPNIYRAWRTWGISGGMVDWHEQSIIAEVTQDRTYPVAPCPRPNDPGFWADYRGAGLDRFHERWDKDFWTYYKPTGHLDVRKEVNNPMMAYLGGPPERFTAKDHHFFPGQSVTKQVILINDSRRKRDVTVKLNVTFDGQPLALSEGSDECPVTLEIGEIRKLPFAFVLPGDKTGKNGRIRLTVSEPDRKDLTDEFAFQVFPPEKVSLHGQVALYDPAGRSSEALKEIGCVFTPVQAGDDLSSYSILVIGSRALPEGHADRLPIELAGFLARGGSVLVLEQTDKALFYRFGFRSASPCSRWAWVGDRRHPILEGLDDADLANWNGSGTLVNPYPVHKDDLHEPMGWWNGFYNARHWKWGNYGSVATTLIEKPHTPGLVPLVQAEFDLQYTPLLEWRGPKGKAIFFQFDASGRTAKDPVAQRLLARTLTYLDGEKPALEVRPTFYAGDADDAKLLGDLYVSFQPVKDVAALPPEALLIVGRGHGLPTDKLAEFVRRGGNLFLLPTAVEGDMSWIAPGLKTPIVNLSKTGDLPDDAFFRGLTLADVHWRMFQDRQGLTDLPADAAADRAGLIARIPSGQGSFLFCQIDPRAYDIQARPYLRRSQKNSYSLLARLLANAGADAQSPIWTYRYTGPTPLNGTWRIRKAIGKYVGPSQAGVEVDDSKWQEIQVPGTWEGQLDEFRDYDGSAWYRTRFVIPESIRGRKLSLCFVVDDFDETYFNGQKIGQTNKQTNPDDYWKHRRSYPIPENLIRYGRENVLAIKVSDVWMSAGIVESVDLVPANVQQGGSVYLTELKQGDDPYWYSKW